MASADVSTSSASASSTGPPKLPPMYKMFIAPVVMMGLNKAGIDYKDPMVVLTVRILYIISQGLILLVCAYLARQIWTKGDADTVVKVKKPKMGGGFQTEEKTVKDYEKGELIAHLKTLGISLVATAAMHAYYTMLPALILQIVMQPISMVEHGLFAVYVLGYSSLPRPFPEKAPPSLPWGAPAAPAESAAPQPAISQSGEAAAAVDEATEAEEEEDEGGIGEEEGKDGPAGEEGEGAEPSTLRRRQGGRSDEAEG